MECSATAGGDYKGGLELNTTAVSSGKLRKSFLEDLTSNSLPCNSRKPPGNRAINHERSVDESISEYFSRIFVNSAVHLKKHTKK